MAAEQLGGQENKFVFATGGAESMFRSRRALSMNESYLAQMRDHIGKQVRLRYFYNERVGIPFEEPSGFTQVAHLHGELVELSETHVTVAVAGVEDGSRYKHKDFAPGRQYSLPYYEGQRGEGRSREEQVETCEIDGVVVFNTDDERRTLEQNNLPLYAYYSYPLETAMKLDEEATSVVWDIVEELLQESAVYNDHVITTEADVVVPEGVDFIKADFVLSELFDLGGYKLLPGPDRPDFGTKRERFSVLALILKANPDKAAFWHAVGNEFANLGMLERAKVCFARGLDINPDISSGWPRYLNPKYYGQYAGTPRTNSDYLAEIVKFVKT